MISSMPDQDPPTNPGGRDVSGAARADVPTHTPRRDVLRRAVLAAAAFTAAPLVAACGTARTNTASAGAARPSAENTRRTDELLRRWDPDRVAARRTARERTAMTSRTVDRPAAPRLPEGVIPRSEWARGAPVPARMDPMQPIQSITFHHDAIDRFTSTNKRDAAARLERIRLAHRSRPVPFGDIGYHYIIDPAGRVWQGRPLDWQGAHVARQNHGNLGICVLGNYEIQQPNADQEHAIARLLASQMRTYAVPANRVYTHRELASTRCPGRFLQPRIADIRASVGRRRVS